MKHKLHPWHIIFIAAFFLSAAGLKVWQYQWPTERIMLAGEALTVMVAKTPVHRFKGLGGRESLGRHDGMLFVFPELARHGIVMRDMQFSIDVVWLFEGEVVDIAPSLPLQPGVLEGELRGYFPRAPADTVLELRAGWAAAHNLKIGDRLEAS